MTEGASSESVVCPSCGRLVEPVEVVYGYPTRETWERAERGEVSLGGCQPPVAGVLDLPLACCPACKEPFIEQRRRDDGEGHVGLARGSDPEGDRGR